MAATIAVLVLAAIVLIIILRLRELDAARNRYWHGDDAGWSDARRGGEDGEA